MSYFAIENFNFGLDARRLPEATPPGALIQAENVVINRGGELESVKKFVLKYNIPAGTFGLAAVKDNLYVFGSVADPGVPAGITYQRLQHETGGVNMTAILNYDIFAGKLFVVAQFDNGDTRAFYDGTRVAGLLPGSGTAFDGLNPGAGVRLMKSKMYACNGTNLLFSALGDASKFDEAATGSGLIDITLEVSEEADIVGMQRYQDKLAVASGKNISLWAVDPDPTKYQVVQVLDNMSLLAARTFRSFGDKDVFGLMNTGFRSLEAMNASLAAAIDDVGTPIDDLVTDYVDTLSADVVAAACSVIEPKVGRYLCSLGEKIFAFTFFKRSKISAWTTMAPGLNMTDMVTTKSNRLYTRAGNQVYLYGGDANTSYTENQVTVELPYLDAKTISTWKKWKGIDIVCKGKWTVEYNYDPEHPDIWVGNSTITSTTLAKTAIGIAADAPVFKLRLTHQKEEKAVLSKIILHYEKTPKED